ncbi:hypothetical protein COV24_00825 [candidate division WWE3 bacterium CG10_big_fil_rev_8_21_14_0_10_32_10]|uniref:SH3b domain-containing protein n=1 Tax=candidate division WWE3 bacterium CG10_big_fil_rev_8_21_14_0_10_32_10 TaxID=1975090 RepID=A0A2H0RBA8_UNCKA|nr:MAG: hypothetical protein COV24_00825 [candidate division WWE3 bacterium CG10_big_fil_rev_8_21_14_0_10_32_10]
MNKNYLPIITPIVILIIGLSFLGYTYYKNISNKPAALSISSKYKDAEVTFKDKSYGKTPIEETDLKPGRGELIIKTKDNEFKKEIILTEAALTVVSADVGVSDNFSGNLVLWYDKTGQDSSQVFVASTPTGSTVKINNQDFKETPVTISESDINNKENNEYTILIEKSGYESQKITVKLEKGYKLNISSHLFLKPIPGEVEKMETTNIYTVYGFRSTDLSGISTGEWASAIAYWLDTRGAALIGAENITYFDYFVDSEGTLYNGKGDVLDKDKEKLQEVPKDLLKIAFLNQTDTSEVTDKAKETLGGLLGKEAISSIYKVTETGVGYLNVRKTPDLNGELAGKLNVGDTVEVIEQQGDWYKIKFEDSEAYAYATYIEKVEAPTPAPQDNNTEEDNTGGDGNNQ